MLDYVTVITATTTQLRSLAFRDCHLKWILKMYLFYLLCLKASYSACVHGAHPQRSEEGREPPSGRKESNLGHLQEQRLLLDTEPSLQPREHSFSCGFCSHIGPTFVKEGDIGSPILKNSLITKLSYKIMGFTMAFSHICHSCYPFSPPPGSLLGVPFLPKGHPFCFISCVSYYLLFPLSPPPRSFFFL